VHRSLLATFLLNVRIVLSRVRLSTGVELDIGFIDHYNTQVVNRLSDSVIAGLLTLQFTRTPSNILTLTRRFLVTGSNKFYSSASRLKSSLNRTSLLTELFFSQIPIQKLLGSLSCLPYNPFARTE
jgi:hypothetical protein